MNTTGFKVVCFGEILWDNLPSGRKPGGAPMNVAYHLRQHGIDSVLISRVGNDPDGKELLRFLEHIGISTNLCQTDHTYPTSTVGTVITEEHDINYQIHFPVAWDFIEPDDQRLIPIVSEAEALVYGSLSGRNDVTRKTLSGLLEASPFRVLDINLRKPYYKQDDLSELLRRADLLKLNSDELKIVAEISGRTFNSEEDKIKQLQEHFKIREILITKGIEGASCYTEDDQYHVSSHKVTVKDTVGSGDSFLSAFLAKRFSGKTIGESLSYASALAGFITSHHGACPPYTTAEVELFISDYASSMT